MQIHNKTNDLVHYSQSIHKKPYLKFVKFCYYQHLQIKSLTRATTKAIK